MFHDMLIVSDGAKSVDLRRLIFDPANVAYKIVRRMVSIEQLNVPGRDVEHLQFVCVSNNSETVTAKLQPVDRSAEDWHGYHRSL